MALRERFFKDTCLGSCCEIRIQHNQIFFFFSKFG